MVASETATPVSSSKASQCSFKVRSGLSLRCPGNHSLKAPPFTEGLPGISWMATSPVRHLLLSQRLMVEREIPKSSATSFLGMPRSMAASVFNLRSFEYAFMMSILVQGRYLRKPMLAPEHRPTPRSEPYPDSFTDSFPHTRVDSAKRRAEVA